MTPGKASRYSGGCFFAVPEKAGPGLVLAGCIIAEYFCSIIFKYPFAADGYRLLGEELEDRFCKGGNGVFPCSWNSRFHQLVQLPGHCFGQLRRERGQ